MLKTENARKYRDKMWLIVQRVTARGSEQNRRRLPVMRKVWSAMADQVTDLTNMEVDAKYRGAKAAHRDCIRVLEEAMERGSDPATTMLKLEDHMYRAGHISGTPLPTRLHNHLVLAMGRNMHTPGMEEFLRLRRIHLYLREAAEVY